MVSIEEITVPGCVDCLQFEKFWDSVKDQFPGATFTIVDATTPEGMEKLIFLQMQETMKWEGIGSNPSQLRRTTLRQRVPLIGVLPNG